MTISRRTVQILLGLAWLLDGLFQLKPQMFSSVFIQQVILPTAEGQPAWVGATVKWGAHVISSHIGVWDAIFAAVQIAIGLALMFNFKTKATSIASIIWCAVVWVFGEGFGQLLTGQSLLLNGAPGAVLIYGFIGAATWTNDDKASGWNPKGIRFAQLSLSGLFVLGCALHLQGSYLNSNGFSQAIALPWLANTVGGQGIAVSIVLAAVELVLAVMLVAKVGLRFVVWVSFILSLVYWWVGQSFGQIFDPLATDFNSGLLMAILALCAYPQAFSTRLRGPVPQKSTA